MSNATLVLDTIEVTDLVDNTRLKVEVRSRPELGNPSHPALQLIYLGYVVDFEPLQVERWADQARRAGQTVLLLDDASWDVLDDHFVRNSLVLEDPPRVRVEVKTGSRCRPVVREYPLPFALTQA